MLLAPRAGAPAGDSIEASSLLSLSLLLCLAGD
jgi:hypothetical protein